MIEEVPYPHSIGMLWERMAAYLGFDEYDAAKVMGLAAFGIRNVLPRPWIVCFTSAATLGTFPTCPTRRPIAKRSCRSW